MKLFRLSKMNRNERVEMNISTASDDAKANTMKSEPRPGPSTAARNAKVGAIIWAGNSAAPSQTAHFVILKKPKLATSERTPSA